MIKLKPIFIEILILLLFSLAALIFDLFIFFQPNLSNDPKIRETYHEALNNLKAKQARASTEKNNLVKLQQWQIKDNYFYKIVLSASNTNQQLSFLTKLIQNAHFQILKATQVNILKKPSSGCKVTFTTNGNFIDLFSLITSLIHFPIPFTLLKLSIIQHQYEMTFLIRGSDA